MDHNDTLVRRVALKLVKIIDNPSRDIPEAAIAAAMDDARALISVMRDLPDQLGCYLPKGYKAGSHSAREIWQAFIDASIAEGT